MAGIEMEVDLNRPTGLNSHVDDDLIDFDMDMHDEHGPTIQLDDSNELHPTEVITDVDEIDIDVETGEGHLEQEFDAEMSEEADFIEIEETMDDADRIELEEAEDAIEYEHGVEDHEEDVNHQGQETGIDVVEISQDHDYLVDQTEDPDRGSEKAYESGNEIDYETEEQPKQEPDPTSSHGALEAPVLDSKTGDAPDGILATGGQTVQNDGPELVSEDVIAKPKDTHSNHGDTGDVEAEEEITYDEDDGHDPDETLVQSDGAIAHERSEETQHTDEDGNNEPVEHPHEEFGNQATSQNDDAEHANDDEYDVAADAEEENFEENAEENAEEHGGEHGGEHGEEHGDEDEEEPAEEQLDDGLTHESDHEQLVPDHDSAAASDNEFPAVTVQYKGDEFPLLSNDSNGFFAETAILDATMDKVLSGFRDELANEICHEDELVFQVDELGLEFTESSGHDSLSTVTLRQILEIFDLLVKNQDPDSSRTLYTYLFTKPCTAKRLEFLIESATAGKGLDEVIHLFETPGEIGASLLDTNTVDEGQGENSELYDSPADEKEEPNADELELGAGDENDNADVDASSPAVNNIGDEAKEAMNRDHTGSGHDDGGYPELDEEDTLPTQHVSSEAGELEEQHDSNAPDESEPNPFLHLELDDGAEENDVDFGADGLDQQDQNEYNVADVDTAASSTTATLKEEDETSSLPVEAGAEATTGDSNKSHEPDDEDQLEEIDWREEPETHNDVPSPQSATGKRARGDDDDVDAEDEQDVKRRRP